MKRLAPSLIVLAALALAAGAAQGSWPLAAAALGCGAVWLAGELRGWPWAPAFGLTSALALGALGMFLQLAPLAMLTGGCAALAAWDLGEFARRLGGVGRVDDRPALVSAHLRRLLAALGAGWALGALALVARFGLSFEWALALAVVALFGLSRLMGWMRPRS